MERRNLRRIIAQQLEGKILDQERITLIKGEILGPEATPEQVQEFNRQLDFVLEPLVKKLRRAQGQGKQTGQILSIGAGNVMVGSPAPTAELSEIPSQEEAVAG